jgi:hypothetical protein
MKKLFLIAALFWLGIGVVKAQDSTYIKVLEYVNCGYAKTFTYKLSAECQENEVVLTRWLLKDVGTPAENTHRQSFYFAYTNNGGYELTKGRSHWEEFSKKAVREIDSLAGLDAERQAVFLGLSKTDSLHNAVNRLPAAQKKRDNYWKAQKVKKEELESFEVAYKEAKAKYEDGEIEPSEWDKIEVKYLNLKQEVDFLKTALKRTNDQISFYREAVARLKKETGLLEYKSYREGSY